MKIEHRKHFSAWFLMTVFLSFLLAASLHVHKDTAYDSYDHVCVDCLHHKYHSAHLSNSFVDAHMCALCQFLGLSYLIVASTTICLTQTIVIKERVIRNENLYAIAYDTTSPRAPPYFKKNII